MAARDVAAGALMTTGDIRLVRLGADVLPRGVVCAASDVVGRRAAGPLVAGELVTDTRLLGPGLLTGMPPGTTTVVVPVDGSAVVAGLSVGARVDVFAIGLADPVAADVTVVGLLPAGDQASALPGVALAMTRTQAGRIAVARGSVGDGATGGFLLAAH